MKAAQITEPNKIETIDTPIPTPIDDEVIIKVMASGICGTDIHILRGEYMGEYPIIPGHEFSGVIESIGSAVTRFKPGDRVAVEPNIACDNCFHCLNNRHNFCLNWSAVGVTRPGGMAQYVTAPEKSVFDIGELSFEYGAFVEPLSCVLHGVERLGPDLASKIVIVGAGPIGILLLKVLNLKGASEIVVVDTNVSRANFAKEMGASQIFTDLDDVPKDVFDVMVDATGVIPVMNRCTEFVRPGGKVLLFGVPPMGAKLSLEAFPIFSKELTILSSFTSVRNSYQALDLLKQGRINLEGLISHKLPLEELQHGIELIERGAENVKKVLIQPNS
ncbi:MAG: zinc-dependent alcohol dehydrogenase family protein [Candidatus Bathyarchaeota archaeon]|nr:zinc-dependent alcohol dehydrogenase family protein [Candidatus Bathyarchaeota archaeon]